MFAVVVVSIVLLLTVVETVRGFLQPRADAQKDAWLGFGSIVACVTYLIRNQVSESVLAAFVLAGLTIAWIGYVLAARRPGAAVPSRATDRHPGKAWVLAVLAADVLAIALIATGVGHTAWVIGTFVVVNLLAFAVVFASHRREPASGSGIR